MSKRSRGISAVFVAGLLSLGPSKAEPSAWSAGDKSTEVRYWHSFWVNSGLISDITNRYLTSSMAVETYSVVQSWSPASLPGRTFLLAGSFGGESRAFTNEELAAYGSTPIWCGPIPCPPPPVGAYPRDQSRDKLRRWEVDGSVQTAIDKTGTYYALGLRFSDTSLDTDIDAGSYGRRSIEMRKQRLLGHAGFGITRSFGDFSQHQFFASALAMAGASQITEKSTSTTQAPFSSDSKAFEFGIDASTGYRYNVTIDGSISVAARYRLVGVGTADQWKAGQNEFIHGPELSARVQY